MATPTPSYPNTLCICGLDWQAGAGPPTRITAKGPDLRGSTSIGVDLFFCSPTCLTYYHKASHRGRSGGGGGVLNTTPVHSQSHTYLPRAPLLPLPPGP